MKSRGGFRVGLGCIGLAVASLLAPLRVEAGGYIFRTIDVPGASGGTYAIGVNPSGLMTGYYADAGGYHGFTWQNGTATPVDYTGVSGVTATFRFQENSSGQAAGYYTGSDGNSHSLVYNSGNVTWTTIPDAPGGYPFNAAGGINDNGQLAGNDSTDKTAASNLVGWLDDIKSNTYTSFTVPQASPSRFGTATYRMNNRGDIAGLYPDSSGNYHNAAFRIMPTGVRRVTRDPAIRAGASPLDAA